MGPLFSKKMLSWGVLDDRFKQCPPGAWNNYIFVMLLAQPLNKMVVYSVYILQQDWNNLVPVSIFLNLFFMGLLNLFSELELVARV